MRRVSTLSLALLTLWLVASLGAKFWRYGQAGEPEEKRTGRAIEAFLGLRGWKHADRRPLTAAGVYKVDYFIKQGCLKPLIVVQLGRNDEAAALVRERLGEDLAFITATAAGAVTGAGVGFPGIGFPGLSWRPKLAVSPAPVRGEGEAACGTPAEAEWILPTVRSLQAKP